MKEVYASKCKLLATSESFRHTSMPTPFEYFVIRAQGNKMKPTAISDERVSAPARSEASIDAILLSGCF